MTAARPSGPGERNGAAVIAVKLAGIDTDLVEEAAEDSAQADLVPTDLIDADMDKLARELVKEAMGATTALQDRVDIFKAVATYRLGVKKIKKPLEPVKSNGPNFGSMRKAIGSA